MRRTHAETLINVGSGVKRLSSKLCTCQPQVNTGLQSDIEKKSSLTCPGLNCSNGFSSSSFTLHFLRTGRIKLDLLMIQHRSYLRRNVSCSLKRLIQGHLNHFIPLCLTVLCIYSAQAFPQERRFVRKKEEERTRAVYLFVPALLLGLYKVYVELNNTIQDLK